MVAEAPFDYQLQLLFPKQSRRHKPTRQLNIERELQELLKQDLTFKGEKTSYATHHIHPFPAKFPPQLPRAFIEALTYPGECVLDPMAGSGTTLVEAILADRNAIGVDLDPLATLIARAKTTHVDLASCAQVGGQVMASARSNLRSRSNLDITRDYSPEAVEFFRYWFDPSVIPEIHALVQAIRAVQDADIRVLLQVVLSSTIIAKTGGLSRARDLAHSRPHRDKTKELKRGAFQAFADRLQVAIKALSSMGHVRSRSVVWQADARELPLEDGSVHLIVTSPPYAANAIDYMRAHKFSLTWLGYELRDLSQLRGRYIGSEIRASSNTLSSPTSARVLGEFHSRDANRASVVAHYFHDIEAILREMLRVLCRGRAAILVVGSSTIRGIDIEAPTVVAELAKHVGFRVVGTAMREIVRDARMMPVSHKTTKNGIEARMHHEGIIGLIKPF